MRGRSEGEEWRERREGEEWEKWSGERSEGRGEGRRGEEVRWMCEVCIGIHDQCVHKCGV